MERVGEKRQEVFELMKLSRYLHRSGIAKLPALPNEAASITEGLAKIDSNMVKYDTRCWNHLAPHSTLSTQLHLYMLPLIGVQCTTKQHMMPLQRRYGIIGTL